MRDWNRPSRICSPFRIVCGSARHPRVSRASHARTPLSYLPSHRPCERAEGFDATSEYCSLPSNASISDGSPREYTRGVRRAAEGEKRAGFRARGSSAKASPSRDDPSVPGPRFPNGHAAGTQPGAEADWKMRSVPGRRSGGAVIEGSGSHDVRPSRRRHPSTSMGMAPRKS